MYKMRPGQKEALEYQSGLMGISAVPGSGKTHTLSAIAANLVASEILAEDQEVLIVTLVNSAVDNFSSRVAGFLKERNLVPNIGYRVRTLHGLAYDIVRERPELAAIDNQFSILDEREGIEILEVIVMNWMRSNPGFLTSYSNPNSNPENNTGRWQDLLSSIAINFIRLAKDKRLTPSDLNAKVSNRGFTHDLLNFGCTIYSEYQQALANRGGLDFDDLIRLACKAVENNPDFLLRLQNRWPFILEDEAQDSSQSQEHLLKMLCGQNGNWIRVGDPNQAIFETFTTASPELLINFLNRQDVRRVDLRHSGRSSESIMNLANYLINWTTNNHPVGILRQALNPPLIYATPEGDIQPNPIDNPAEIKLIPKGFKAAERETDPDEEINRVASSVKIFIQENPEKTVAILVTNNARGSRLAERLTKEGVPTLEMLRINQSTLDTLRTISSILDFLAQPQIQKNLIHAITQIIKNRKEWNLGENASQHFLINLFKDIHPEMIFNQQTIEEIVGNAAEIDEKQRLILIDSIVLLEEIQKAVILPIDQMTITIGGILFNDPSDLALVHKLALMLKTAGERNAGWTLTDFCAELKDILRSRQKLYGFSEEDLGFDPEMYKGIAVISTFHKAKGLEWDRVYLMSVNNYDFPSLQPDDHYQSEKYFVRDSLNLEAETLALLESTVDDLEGILPLEGSASIDARINYCAERLRLLFVGITRAKSELVITWNTGRFQDCVEALPLRELRSWWEGLHVVG